MKAIVQFFSRMDKRAARAIGVSLGLFALVAAIFIVGRFGLGFEPGAVQNWLASVAHEWYALPITGIIFVVLSFIGVPQFALIAAAVFAFGPVTGFIVSWVSTIISASINFWVGRLLGADVLRRYGGDMVNRVSDFVGRNGFWASLMVRIVPSAPFIVVNMAAGVSRMSYFAFIAGAGIGIIPKTALVAFAGQGLMALLSEGRVLTGVLLFLAAAAWLAIMLLARKWMRGPERKSPSGAMDGTD